MEISSNTIIHKHYQILSQIRQTQAYNVIDTISNDALVLKLTKKAEEIDILSTFSHANILKVIEHFSINEDTPTSMCYIAPRYDMDLFEFITKYSTIEDSIKKIAKLILNGIKYIHSRGYSHGSIMLEHIYLSITCNGPAVCIGGFGKCHKVDLDDNEDIFGFGTVLYQLFSQNTIKIGVIDELLISEEAKDLLKKCLSTNPKSRISIDNALNHKWFSTSLDDV